MEQETVQSLTKALDIMEVFLKTKKEMALSEIADALNMNKSTVRRLMTTLIQRGYIYQKENRGKYSLGMIYLNFSGAIKSQMPFRGLAIPYLIRLSYELNESVVLSLIEGKDRVLTETFRNSADYLLKAISSESATVLLHATCLGKIALSTYSDEELERYFNTHNIERRTPNTITSVTEMQNHLKSVREEGVAFDNEENTLGVRGIAAALRDGEGTIIGSIGVIVPTVRMSRNQVKKLAPVIKDYALQISREFGYKSN
jgi:IclR family KDG regulon transcriptional repressor